MIKTVTKKRLEIENLYRLLAGIKDKTFNPKFSFFVIRNYGLMESEMIALEEVRNKIHESIQSFDTKRSELAASFADKDDNGAPIIENNSYKIVENFQEFNEEFKKLADEHKEDFEKSQELEKSLVELLNEEVEQKIMKIAYSDIPEDTFTIEQLFNMKDFFKETEDELDELIMG